MKPVLPLSLAAALIVSLGASPAAAKVEDPLGLLGEGLGKAVEIGLENMGAAQVDVMIIPSAADDPTVMAGQLFTARAKGRAGGIMIVPVRQGGVGVHLGADYSERGVTPELIKRLVARVYTPEAAKGNHPDAVLSLMEELKLARTLGRDPAVLPAPAPVKLQTPWWLYLAPLLGLAAGGCVLAIARFNRRRRRKARLARLLDRLEDARYKLGRIASQLAAVPAEREGLQGVKAAHAELARLGQEAESRLKSGAWSDAEATLDALDAQEPRIATEAAACATPQSPEALSLAATAQSRFERLQAAHRAWAAEPGQGGSPQQLAERLDQLRRALTTPPVDYAEVGDLLDATEAIYARWLNPAPLRG